VVGAIVIEPRDKDPINFDRECRICLRWKGLAVRQPSHVNLESPLPTQASSSGSKSGIESTPRYLAFSKSSL
jgi:hypothetical protein